VIRVLYVQPNAEIGGADIALWRLLRNLDKQRYTPIVVAPRRGPLTLPMEEAGALVRIVPMRQLRPLPDPLHQLRYVGSFRSTVARLARVIREEHIDIVHSNSLFCLYGAFAARSCRRHHVWHVREILSRRHPARAMLTKLAVQLSAQVITTSPAVSTMFGTRSLNSGRITSLAEGVDVHEYSPEVNGAALRARLNIPLSAPLIGFVARLDPWKGLEIFLRAASLVGDQFPHARFLIAGDAPPGYEPYARRMRVLAGELGLGERTHFLGWCSPIEAMPAVMAALDIYVHCSTSPEPWGLTILEAMSSGKPVVAANAGGPTTIVVSGKTGWLVTPNDPTSLAGKLIALLQDPELTAAMGEASRQRVLEQFALPAYVREIETLYDLLAEQRPYPIRHL
jgi:glycosyltransferase involved in cell wall biosynthesis